MADDTIVLTIAGQRFDGWTSAEISLDLDSLADGFSLGLAERSGDSAERLRVLAGDAMTLAIGSETMITGFIDATDIGMSGEDHTIMISGRSKAADLVDCVADLAATSWANRRLEDLVKIITAPFGVAVSAEADTGAPFAKFALQPGETAWEAIERLCRMRGLLAVSHPDGSILLMWPKPVGAAVRLKLGEAGIEWSARHDVTERFSEIIVRGQAVGTDERHGKDAAQVTARASDAGVKRKRPLVIIAEDQATIASLRARAQWEVSVRAAKAQELTVTLPGWRSPGGKLWAKMQKVNAVFPAGRIDAEMMIAGVSFRRDEGGSTATLRLVLPEAYTPQPVPATAQAGKIKGAGR